MKHLFYSINLRVLLCFAVLSFIGIVNAQERAILQWHPLQGYGIYAETADGKIEDEESTALLRMLVPEDFADVVFDASGLPTMDELYVFFSFPEEMETEGEYYLPFTKDGDVYTLGDFDTANETNFVFKNCNGKHLYFTGKCRSAYPGDPAANTAGVFFLQGGSSETVHIYLHNFEMQVQDKLLGQVSMGDIFKAIIPGSMASVFAVGTDNERTSTPFTANFHICGENTLTGGNRSIFTGSGSIMTVFADILTRTNSPIAICPTTPIGSDFEAKSARLLFDDEVPIKGVATKVNGKLNLPLKGSRSTPAVDLGNGNGFCEFNGGQYRFATPASNSMFYVCSMAICYKQFSVKQDGMSLSFYGIGSSVGTSTVDKDASDNKVRVIFNDGTFSTYPSNEYADDNIDVVARGWYADYTDLRLSYESRINGGTFNNCRVYRCDASAERGSSPVNDNHEQLCYKELTVPAPAGKNGVLSATQMEELITRYPDLKQTLENYGSSSLTPVKEDDTYKLYLYLPLGECSEGTSDEAYVHNWVTVIPQMGLEGVLTMGGDVAVEAMEGDEHTPRKNSYLFYARLNDYTKQYASVNLGIDITVQDAISVGGGHEFTSVTNSASYQIAHGLYTMLSFNTNQWYTLTMPYDVANFYVIETTETQKGADEKLGDFLKRQGEADGDLASTIITSLCPDILSGKGSGVAMNLIDIAKYQLDREPIRLFPYNPDAGYGADKAHFYLYEQQPAGYDEWSPTQPYWDFSADADDYGKMWTRVTPESFAPADGVHDYIDQEGNPVPAGNIWMKKGHVYSIFLPDTESSRYWDGKYLIFEGYGPQDILGTDAHMPDNEGYWPQEYVDDDKAFIQGNATFANQTVSEQVFIPTVDTQRNYEFTRVDEGTEIKPCEVMMVLSPDNTNAHQYIKRGGPVAQMNESSQAVADDNLPKVSDIALVAKASDGIVLYSYAAQQVNIYTLDGRLLYSDTLSDGSVVRVPAASGVYLVQGQEQTYKLIVP